MIYAIIIIVALALAFIIVIRRLPSAIEVSRESNLDRLPRPSEEHRPSTIPAAAASIRPRWQFKNPFKGLALRLPIIRLPRFPKRQNNSVPVAKPVVTEELKRDNDFWASAATLKPISEPETTIDKPVEKSRGKNLSQEADDLFAVGDFRKAERLYIRLATEDPKNPKVYSRLGIIYLEQKNYEDARDALQQAIKFEPTIASRHFNLALAYINLGSKAKAINAMEMALKYDPSNRKYRKMLDEILIGRA